jgi:hypothetical protein
MKGPFRNVMLLFLSLIIFSLPLFGQNRNTLTLDLGKMIKDRNNDIAAATSLLEKGADPNGTLTGYLYDNMTFLMQSVVVFERENVAMTKLLLDYGADPNVRNSNGEYCCILCRQQLF